MNAQSKNVAKFPWVKVGLIIGVVVLVGIFSGREGIEDMFGLEPGTLGGTAVAEREKDKDPGAPHADLESDKHTGETHHDSTSESDKRNSNPQPKFELKRDGFVMKSPEGLTYYVGDRGENRIDHVMRHAKDNSSRAVHGVFTGSKNEILKTIDEAYALVKSKSRQVIKSTKDREIQSRMAYEVDMKRKIGYKGGQSGTREGKPELRILKLILDKGNRVITAYPFR